MPRGDQLPPSIAPMVRRQALELSPNRFRADTERLLDVMERTLADIQDEQPGESPVGVAAPTPVQPEPEPEPKPQPTTAAAASPARSRRTMVAAGSAVAAVAVAALIWVLLPDNDSDGGKDDPTKDPTNAATEPPKLGGPDAPVVLAHRGGDEKFALQTIPAYEHAAKIGAAVEMDVRWSKDGFPVLVHDKNTVPGMQCEGGGFVVQNANWEDMRDGCRSPALTEGGEQYPIPLLDQAVAAVAKIPGAVIYPEVKVEQTGRQVRQFVTILTISKMTGRTIVTSGIPGELGKIHEEAQNEGVDDLRLMQFVSTRVPVANLEDDLWGVAVRFDVASKAYLAALHDADLQVMVWNINTPGQWADAVDAGADIVMTDRPKEFGDWFAGR
jgi:glycerophosphoryl diester phosphodiesterase